MFGCLSKSLTFPSPGPVNPVGKILLNILSVLIFGNASFRSSQRPVI